MIKYFNKLFIFYWIKKILNKEVINELFAQTNVAENIEVVSLKILLL